MKVRARKRRGGDRNPMTARSLLAGGGCTRAPALGKEFDSKLPLEATNVETTLFRSLAASKTCDSTAAWLPRAQEPTEAAKRAACLLSMLPTRPAALASSDLRA